MMCLSLIANAGPTTLRESLANIPKAKPLRQYDTVSSAKDTYDTQPPEAEKAALSNEALILKYKSWKSTVNQSGKALDEVAKKVEEYGIITMSAPVLAGPNADFTFDLDMSEKEYFDNAKSETEVAVGSAERIVQSFSGKLEASADQAALEKYLAEKAQFATHTAAKDAVYQNELKSARERFRQERLKASAETDPAKKAKILQDAQTAYDKDVNDATTARYGAAPPAVPTAQAPAAPTADAVAAASSKAATDIAGAADAAVKAINEAAAKVPAGGNTGYTQTTVNLAGVPAPTIDPATGLPVANEARSVLQAITNMQALNAVTQAKLKTPDRAALIQAAGNRAVHAIFEYLGDPNAANQFRDKQVMFGVSTIGVSPGWRTQRDFAADVAINVSYEYQLARYDTIARLVNDMRYPQEDRVALGQPYGITPADAVVLKDGSSPIVNHGGALFVSVGQSSFKEAETELKKKTPVVSGVSPMMDTQVSDLESQWRRQDEFALLLSGVISAPGSKASGGAFQQYLKNRQSDARSRTVSGVVNTYSAAGGLFGFQVGPRLQALADPATKKAGQGRVLERQSFPAAIIFGLDHNDIRPVIVKDASGRMSVYEPAIKLVQTTRWTNVVPRFSERFVLWKPSSWTRARWSEQNRVKSLLGSTEWLARQKGQSEELANSYSGITDSIDSLMGERFEHYSYLAGGANTTLSIPAATMMSDNYQLGAAEAFRKLASVGSPKIKKIIPPGFKVVADKPVQIVILGDNLDRLSDDDPVVEPAGKLTAKYVKSESSAGARVVVISLDKSQNQAAGKIGAGLQLKASDGNQMFSPPLTVDIPAFSPPPKTNQAPATGAGAAATPPQDASALPKQETPTLGAEKKLVSVSTGEEELTGALLLLPELTTADTETAP